MLYRVTHTTTYLYSEPVSLCHNVVHLTPRETPYQRCVQHRLSIQPMPAVSWNGTDYFGNPVSYFTIQEPHTRLVVTARHQTELHPAPTPIASETPPWDVVRDRMPTDRTPEVLAAYQFVFDSAYIKSGPDLIAYAKESFPNGRPLLEAVLDLTKRIHTDFTYDPEATTILTPLREVLAKRRGVCQDFAHLQIAMLRSLGLAARYVSGYLRTLPPPGQPRLIGADASHAWLSVFSPDLGWVDFDPTNNCIPAEKYITLAWGRDYDDVSPIKGVILGGGQHSIKVSVDVLATGERF